MKYIDDELINFLVMTWLEKPTYGMCLTLDTEVEAREAWKRLLKIKKLLFSKDDKSVTVKKVWNKIYLEKKEDERWLLRQ